MAGATLTQKVRGLSEELAQIIQRADIVHVAKSLGLQVDIRSRRPVRAICPFHDDSDPSLNLYRNGGDKSTRDHYHCFVCGAHGDALSLIQNYLRITFQEAAKRLAQIQGVELREERQQAVDRRSGAEMLVTVIKASPDNDPNFSAFAFHRGFEPQLLRRAGIALIDLRPLVELARDDRTAEEKLVQAGIFRRDDNRIDQDDLYGVRLKGFYSGKRIVIELNAANGDVVGFAARSLKGEQPKYLYSYEFPRRNTLYGCDRVLAALRTERQNNKGQPVEIYVVEGIFDVIRLENLGHKAVGILGSRITEGQLQNIQLIVDAAGESGRNVTVHILFDSDEAGRRGAYDAAISLLKLQNHSVPFEVDVISPLHASTEKVDPDSWLRGRNYESAKQVLSESKVPVFRFLAAFRLGSDPHAIDWDKLGRLKIAAEARSIGLSLPAMSWSRILAAQDTGQAGDELARFAQLVRDYGGLGSQPSSPTRAFEKYRDRSDDRANLLTALTLGRTSTSRREYPLDDEAWDRLSIAASPLFHLHRERLALGDAPSSPLLTRELPKGEGRYRMKSGPVAQDALLQQYILLELLKDRPECPAFANHIPAVRFDRNRPFAGGIYRTGLSGERSSLSFAYQIDMEVVNGDTPPRREGIFRPYFECWRSFVDFLDDRIKRFGDENLQILRLDITGFYDNIQREPVGKALATPLERALHLLRIADDEEPTFAPMLMPNVGQDAVSRAEKVTDYILNQSFGLRYQDPESGVVKSFSPRRGIPQGPDLSAYLANISLFDLDDMVEAEINRLNEVEVRTLDGQSTSTCMAAYARYVDDIVVICRDLETAYQLRRKIESWLGLRGLSLNRKHVTPPPMTRAEARAWITDNRAGFGFSGPLADLPTTDAMDPLADAGEIDRKTALGLLFDPELDNPFNAEAGLEKIRLALSAADIRFNDRASAYRRLWCIAAVRAEMPTAEAVASTFVNLLNRVDQNHFRLVGESDLLGIGIACFEGLDRALRSPVPAGMLSDEICKKLNENLIKLSRSSLDDVFTSLATQLSGVEHVDNFLSRYDVRCQIGIIACLAAQKLTANSERVSLSKLRAHFNGSSTASGKVPLPEGLRVSLTKYDPDAITADVSLVVSRDATTDAAFTSLNRAIVALQRVAQFGTDEEPSAQVEASSEEPNQIVKLTNEILRIWIPSNRQLIQSNVPSNVEFDAAATLVNITYARFAGVVAKRPRLMQLIADTEEAKPLPSPPGLSAAGIMLWCGNGKLLFATAEPDTREPIGVLWRDALDHGVSGVRLRVADLPNDFVPLFLLDTKWTPGKIAALYRAGFAGYWASLLTDEDVIPVPTAFSFFCRSTGGVSNIDEIRMVSWRARRESVDGHAFVRNGSSLEAKKIHSDGSDFWRYGWAVRDVCGRSDLLTDDETGLDAHAATALQQDIHRREAIVARVLPRLSGADRWGPGSTSPGSAIPTRIDRALSLLENFDKSTLPSVDAAYLVAAVAEGMFMSERIKTDVDLAAPGQPAILMIRSIRRLTRSLPEAAKHWSKPNEIVRLHRRSAAAWQALGEMITKHVPDVDSGAAASLEHVALGLKILASVSELRSLAFELASTLPRDSIEHLEQCELEHPWLTSIAGLDIILIDDNSSTIDSSIDVQARNLIKSFCQIVLGRKGGLNFLRDGIAPAGWAVIVAIMLHVAPVRPLTNKLRPRLWRMSPEKTEEANLALRRLMVFFASSLESDVVSVEWPWDAFAQLKENEPKDLANLLRQITDCASLSVCDETTWSNPRSGDSKSDRPVIRLADSSSISLAEWQIDIAHVRGERGTATEAAQLGNRLLFRYSITRNGDQVLGVHLVSRKLAEASFEHKDINDSSVVSGPPSSFGRQPDPIIELTQDPFSVELDSANSANELKQPLTPSSVIPPVRSHISRSPDLDDVRQIQQKSWSVRSKDKSDGMQRVAIVQWDVDETYCQPGVKGGAQEGLINIADAKVANANEVRSGGIFLSTSEFRRRVILKEVLNACIEFKVDGIVLPEYCVRPETVNWLARYIRMLARPLTIWCGTFRVPSGTQIDVYMPPSTVPFAHATLPMAPAGRSRWDYHTALLTCLRTIKESDSINLRHHVRQKRFPSAAAGELIRPPLNLDWAPMLADTDAFDLGTFTLELICSEMFPHASSANFIGVIQENQELAQRYGLGSMGTTPFQYLSRDIYEFARWTAYRNVAQVAGDSEGALVRGKTLQRTLIILPAMTARSADYHIFGQNQYLAAGLVTAFCNAVAPPYGCGQSGFIGLDGWKITEGIRTPYGSKAPGIFQLGGGHHSGPLGVSEAAVVIADLNLLHTTDQRPTPHYQSRPMQLVAHLPIIFATESGAGNNAGSYPNNRRRPRIRNVSGESKTFEEAIPVIAKALSQETIWRSSKNMVHSDQSKLTEHAEAVRTALDGLRLLEHFADDPEWLKKRTQSFISELYEYPPPSPLPALTDWIYVDDRWKPSPSFFGQLDGEVDPLMSDRPVLTVPKWMKDEPGRKPN